MVPNTKSNAPKVDNKDVAVPRKDPESSYSSSAATFSNKKSVSGRSNDIEVIDLEMTVVKDNGNKGKDVRQQQTVSSKKNRKRRRRSNKKEKQADPKQRTLSEYQKGEFNKAASLFPDLAAREYFLSLFENCIGFPIDW